MKHYIEHIDQLLDGELDQMHESALFAELSVNTDLRQELRDHLAIRSAVKDDRMALVPPAMLTNSVFSGLGFAAPFAGAAATTVGSSVIWQWLTRLGIPLLSALTAAGVSWGVASGSFSDFVATSGASVEPTTQQSTPPQPPPQTPSNAVAGLSESKSPSSSSEADMQALRASEARAQALLQERNQLLAENAGLRDRIKALEDSRTIAQAQPVAETTAPDAESIIVSNVPVTSSFQLSNTYTVQRSQDPQTIRLTTFDGGGGPGPFQKFSVQVRGMSLSPTVTSTVSEQTEWYDNLGFAALYHMNGHSSLGFEVGNEAYPMVFEGDRNGQTVRYDQYPSTMWAGVTYRYTANAFGSIPLAPYGQLLVGGSEFGPMGRAQIGLQYAPAGPLNFLLGFEGSAMTYSFQNQLYVSPKFGLTYGMAYRF